MGLVLFYLNERKKTPLIHPFICGQTLRGVNGCDSIYTPHCMYVSGVREKKIVPDVLKT